MPIRGFLLCALLLVGCGGSAIVNASRHIAELRGCEAVQLTVQASVSSYVAAGCGEPGRYVCTDAACRASEGDATMDAERVASVRGQLEALDAEIADCARGGETPVVQVYFDAGGRPQGLALHPTRDAEVRGCIGALILDHVEAGAGAELLVAHPGDDAQPGPAPVPVPEDAPTDPEPSPDEPVEPPDDGATDGDDPPATTIDDEALP